MNAATTQPMDIEEQRRWLIEHRAAVGLSWNELAKRIGRAAGTISQFGGKNGYNGDEYPIAEAVFRYRQTLVAQARMSLEAPPVPGYFETPTSNELCSLLNWGQQGEIVVAALGPGTGKSETAKHYSGLYANVIVATMTSAVESTADMLTIVLQAFGVDGAKGTPLRLAMQVEAKLNALRNPLLIIDECQHLGEKQIELIRSWNDLMGAGIGLFGDENLLQRLQGSTRKLGLAQLVSRVGFRLVRSVPLAGDVDALAAAWKVDDQKVIGLLHSICSKRGGLRSGTKALRLASMLALAEEKPLALNHLQDAWAQLSSRAIAA